MPSKHRREFKKYSLAELAQVWIDDYQAFGDTPVTKQEVKELLEKKNQSEQLKLF
jgi:hypothetical protein